MSTSRRRLNGDQQLRANKFNIHWQVVRVKARGIRDLKARIYYVAGFLVRWPNTHNYDRVHNWLRMTALGFRGEKRALFQRAANHLQRQRLGFSDERDMDNGLAPIPTGDLKIVFEDLRRRRYRFQFRRPPAAHGRFVQRLETEFRRRGVMDGDHQ